MGAVRLRPPVPVPAPAEFESRKAELIRGRYGATLEWYTLANGVWMLRVFNERGELVDGGLGDEPEQALLEVYERLIPPK
jgi:hypothetical protein